MNGLIRLWKQVGLPIASGVDLRGRPRIVSGAFSKSGVEEERRIKREEKAAEDEARIAALGNSGLLICKRCNKRPRGVTKTMVKLTYCRQCSTELSREYRGKKIK